jgi:DNA-binding YbaB/EbfC family protein
MRERFVPELGMPTDLQGLLAEAEQVQRRLVETQAELARQEVSGSAGSGLVTARVNGTGELMSLSIDPRILRAGDPARMAQAVADLVLAAVRNAERAAAELREVVMAPFSDPLLALDLDPGQATDRAELDGELLDDGLDDELLDDGLDDGARAASADDAGEPDADIPASGRSTRDNECMEHSVPDSVPDDLRGADETDGRGSPHGEIEPFPSRTGLSRISGRAAS